MRDIDPERLERLAAEYDDLGSSEWAVYGDELCAVGDPRGELIAIEQRVARTSDAAARKELEVEFAAVYGRHEPSLVPPWLVQYREGHSCAHTTYIPRYGYIAELYHFFSEAEGGELEEILGSESGHLLWMLDVMGAPSNIESVVAAVGGGSGYLRELSLDLESAFDEVGPEPALAAEFGAALRAKLTHLRRLHIAGSGLIANARLPVLEQLSLVGWDAILDLAEMPLPRLQSLELRIHSIAHSGAAQPSARWWARLFSGQNLPALRSLDLSRNGMGGLRSSRGFGTPEAMVLFDALLDAPILDQLDELVLPPPPSSDYVERMLAASRLGRIPRLRLPWTSFEIDPESLRRAGLRIELGTYFPHPRWVEIEFEEELSVQLEAGGWRSIRASIFGQDIAAKYGTLSDEARRTFDRVLEACLELRELIPDVERPLANFVVDHAEFVAAARELCSPSGRWPVSLEDWAPVLERVEPPGTPLRILYTNPLLRGL